MARSMNKNNSRNTKVEYNENISAENDFVETKEEAKEETKTVGEKSAKVFKNEDTIQCISIVSGKLVLIGNKTSDKYTWDDIGDVQDVAYNDLMSELRNRTSFVFAPWVIIQDKDFLSQHPEIDRIYGDKGHLSNIDSAHYLSLLITVSSNK